MFSLRTKEVVRAIATTLPTLFGSYGMTFFLGQSNPANMDRSWHMLNFFAILPFMAALTSPNTRLTGVLGLAMCSNLITYFEASQAAYVKDHPDAELLVLGKVVSRLCP